MKAKRCPVCGGKPKCVYYLSIPWKTTNLGYVYAIFNKLECEKCGATAPNFALSYDEAVMDWNCINTGREKLFLKRVGEEPCIDVEDENHNA